MPQINIPEITRRLSDCAYLFLGSSENDFINGENIVIDGGMTRRMIYEP